MGNTAGNITEAASAVGSVFANAWMNTSVWDGYKNYRLTLEIQAPLISKTKVLVNKVDAKEVIYLFP